MSTLKQNRKNKGLWANDLFFTLTNMVFEGKQEHKEKFFEKSIDFHVDLTNKIDKILGKSNNDLTSNEQTDNLDENIALKESNVEARIPLSRKISCRNEKQKFKPELKNTPELTINNDLISEINIKDLYNYENISEINLKENNLELNNELEDRIEVIDIESFNKGETKKDEKKILISLEKPKKVDETNSKLKKLNMSGIFVNKAKEDPNSSKKTSFFNIKQSNKSDSISQVYFLRRSKQEESKKPNSEKSSSTNVLDKELNELKEKELELKEQKKKLVEQEKEALKEAKERALLGAKREKENKERQHQEEKLKKLELKKALLEKKEREKEARKATKKKNYELRSRTKEEKLLKKIEMKKAVKLEKEKERFVKKAEQEKIIQQKLKDKEKQMREKEVKKIEKDAFKKDKQDTNKFKIGEIFKREKKEKVDTKKIKEFKAKTEVTLSPEEHKEEKLDEDVKKLLTITDNLLGELPDEVIDKFANSEDFELYSKVLHKYKIK